MQVSHISLIKRLPDAEAVLRVVPLRGQGFGQSSVGVPINQHQVSVNERGPSTSISANLGAFDPSQATQIHP